MLFKLVPPKFWYQKNLISYLLLPFVVIYRVIIGLRKFYYQIFLPTNFSVPIVVVGNITVGGTGKTPLVIYLAENLKKHGFKPGIVSRGYGGKYGNYPLIVTPDSNVEEVGDEALLLARRTMCPVVTSADRNAAITRLLSLNNCNVVISDDGLQHYAMPRNIEIAVTDAEFGFGNGFCLPAGPLREPIERLQHVDFLIKNSNSNLIEQECDMSIEPIVFYNLKNPNMIKNVNEFKGQVVHAFAGIGNPKKFFQTLSQLGLQIIEHPLPDHYVFHSSDFLFKNDEIIVLTEKDAVKCEKIANENFWCLKVQAKLHPGFINNLVKRLSF